MLLHILVSLTCVRRFVGNKQSDLLLALKGGFTVVAKNGQGKWTGAECRDRVELGVCCLCCLGVCLYVWGVRGFLGLKRR